jgi:hypothetical protein
MSMRRVELTALIAFCLMAGSGWQRLIGASLGRPEEDPGVSQETANNPTSPGAKDPAAEPPPSTRPKAAPSTGETAGTPSPLRLNSALEDVVKLLKAGVEEAVLLQHITRSQEFFGVGSDEIIFLTDLGASTSVINAMIERDQQLRSTPPPSSAPQTGEPWPPAGTVATVPAPQNVVSNPEAATLTAAAPATAVTVEYFHHYLAPYGTWVDIPGYCMCWQPAVSVSYPGWMPYRDRGRWLYTDCGWYWYSDYTWGWAAFHYGRWIYHSNWGWCWAPGTIWGPSWVSWRYADPYCGWAPLPPSSGSGFYLSVGISWGIPAWCYTYVPSQSICVPEPRHCAVPHTQAREIHYRAAPRNHYTVGRNHVIENRGIPPEELSRDPGKDIRRAEIQLHPERAPDHARNERLDPAKHTLTVYQPRITDRGSGKRDGKAGVGPATSQEQAKDRPVRPGGSSIVRRGEMSPNPSVRGAPRWAPPDAGKSQEEVDGRQRLRPEKPFGRDVAPAPHPAPDSPPALAGQKKPFTREFAPTAPSASRTPDFADRQTSSSVAPGETRKLVGDAPRRSIENPVHVSRTTTSPQSSDVRAPDPQWRQRTPTIPRPSQNNPPVNDRGPVRNPTGVSSPPVRSSGPAPTVRSAPSIRSSPSQMPAPPVATAARPPAFGRPDPPVSSPSVPRSDPPGRGHRSRADSKH